MPTMISPENNNGTPPCFCVLESLHHLADLGVDIADAREVAVDELPLQGRVQGALFGYPCPGAQLK